jgi:hypothetical protein
MATPSIKVLLSGSFSTGKTTTLSLLRDELEQRQVKVAVTIDPARHCPLPLDLRQGVHTARWLLGDLVTQESELVAQADSEVVLCDGGPPDIVAHTPGHPDLDAAMLGVARSWQPTYDLVFWSRPDANRPIAADDLRILDENYRRRIDNALPAAFDLLGVVVHELPHHGPERVDVMLRKLGVRP